MDSVFEILFCIQDCLLSTGLLLRFFVVLNLLFYNLILNYSDVGIVLFRIPFGHIFVLYLWHYIPGGLNISITKKGC